MNNYYVVIHRTFQQIPFYVDFCLEQDIYKSIKCEKYEKWKAISIEHGCEREMVFNNLSANQAMHKARQIVTQLLNTGETTQEWLCNDFRYKEKVSRRAEIISLYNQGLSFREIASIVNIHESNVYRNLTSLYKIQKNIPYSELIQIETSVVVETYNVSRSKVCMCKKVGGDMNYYIPIIDVSKWFTEGV